MGIDGYLALLAWACVVFSGGVLIGVVGCALWAFDPRAVKEGAE